jgi:hypothetical protein
MNFLSITRRESDAAQHVGRGGGGNVFKPGSAEPKQAKEAQEKNDSTVADGSKDGKGANVADKVKHSLLGKK